MLGNTAQSIGNAALDLVIRLGEIALMAALYFGLAWLVVNVLVNRFKYSPILSRYGKTGSMIVTRLISIAVYLVATVGVLSYMGVNTTGILTLASAFTVAIGLALQDVMRNLISGLFMLAERPFAVGDRVRVRDREGTVQGIDIRTTMLRTDDGALLMVPNQLMFTEILQNNSRFNMRIVRYKISTSLPLEELREVIETAAIGIESVRTLVSPPVLLQHQGDTTDWEVAFSVNARQMTNEHEIGEALLHSLPDATITRVSP